MNSSISDHFELLSPIIGYYLIPAISTFGFFFNIFCIAVLSNKKLKHRIYTFLICNCYIDLMICTLGIGFQNACLDCSRRYTYSLLCYYTFIRFSLRIFIFMSALSGIYLNINRYYQISNTVNYWTRMKLQLYVPLISFLSIFLHIPRICLIQFESLDNDWYRYGFSRTKIARVCLIVEFIWAEFIPMLLMPVGSILLVIKYKERMRFKNTYVVQSDNNKKQNKSRFSKSERHFTLAVVCLNFIFFIIRLVNMTKIILFTVATFSDDSLTFGLGEDLLNSLRIIPSLLFISSSSLSIICYIAVDKNFKKVIKSYLCRCQKVWGDFF